MSENQEQGKRNTAHYICARVLVLILDVIYLGLGIGLLGIGIWLRTDKNAEDLRLVMDTFLGNKLSQGAEWLLIVLGIVVTGVAVLGLMAAIFEWRFLLGLFAGLLIAMILLEIVACGLAAAYKEEAFLELSKNMYNSIKGQYFNNISCGKDLHSPSKDVGKPWNYLQWKFECCGIHSSRDYGPQFMVNYCIPFPYSCCKLRHGADGELASLSATADFGKCVKFEDGFFNDDPCYDKILDLTSENTIAILGIAIAVICFTIFLFIFTICLCVNIHRTEES